VYSGKGYSWFSGSCHSGKFVAVFQGEVSYLENSFFYLRWFVQETAAAFVKYKKITTFVSNFFCDKNKKNKKNKK
jgi:hypothetical protein